MEAVKQSSSILISRGHRVEIICLDAPSDPWIRQYPVKVHALGPGRGGYGYAPRFTRWIKGRHAEYDAVIVHGLWQYSSFGVWRALRGTTTPYFVFPHGMLDPWFNRTYPLKHIKKLLYWPWAEYRVLRDAAAVLFTSEEERRSARESFSPYRCNEVVVNYGTAAPDVDLENARRDFSNSFPQLRETLPLVSRPVARKERLRITDPRIGRDPEFCARRSLSASRHRGPYADESYLQQSKGALPRQREVIAEESPITLTGMLTGNLKWGAFSAADAFVLPSHQENFGIAVVEALACATPVLVSNKVNIWREIVNDGAGFADEDDPAGTTRLIERWIRTPAAERETMRVNARTCFERRFEINRAVDSLLQVLEERAAL